MYIIDSAEREFRDAQIKLETLVEIKVGTEKYYKKLKYEERETDNNDCC